MIDASLAMLGSELAAPAVEHRPHELSLQQRQAVGEKFEGLLLSIMLHHLRQTSGADGLFPGDASDSFGAMFDQYLGEQLARQGGIGLADYIKQSLSHNTP